MSFQIILPHQTDRISDQDALSQAMSFRAVLYIFLWSYIDGSCFSETLVRNLFDLTESFFLHTGFFCFNSAWQKTAQNRNLVVYGETSWNLPNQSRRNKPQGAPFWSRFVRRTPFTGRPRSIIFSFKSQLKSGFTDLQEAVIICGHKECHFSSIHTILSCDFWFNSFLVLAAFMISHNPMEWCLLAWTPAVEYCFIMKGSCAREWQAFSKFFLHVLSVMSAECMVVFRNSSQTVKI